MIKGFSFLVEAAGILGTSVCLSFQAAAARRSDLLLANLVEPASTRLQFLLHRELKQKDPRGVLLL
jgi:hypothetical protein